MDDLTRRERRQLIKSSMINLKEVIEGYKYEVAEMKDIEVFKALKAIGEELDNIVNHYENKGIF